MTTTWTPPDPRHPVVGPVPDGGGSRAAFARTIAPLLSASVLLAFGGSAAAFPDRGSKAAPVARGGSGALVQPVEEVLPDGSVRPLATYPVWLVANELRQGPHGPVPEMVGRWAGQTDAGGEARFDSIPRAGRARYRVTVQFQGVTYQGAELSRPGGRQAALRVYHVTTAPTDVSLAHVLRLQISESSVVVRHTVRIDNRSLQTVDYAHRAAGLRIPTLSHVLGAGGILTEGMFPPGHLHDSPQPSNGRGRVVAEGGAVVFRGPLFPGRDLMFEFSYEIPYDGEDMRLGMVGDLETTDCFVQVVWPERVHPAAWLEQPHRAERSSTGGFVELVLVHDGPLLAGKPLILRLARLPIQSEIPGHIALAGTAFGAAVFILSLIGYALRRRRAAA